jgi:Fe-S-cluster containining protein
MAKRPEQLAEVARGLAMAAALPPGPDGRRHLPVVADEDAAGLVAMMYAQMDAAVAQRDRAAAAAQVTIACHRGCNACCRFPVIVGDHEAVAIAVWLARPAQAAVRAAFEAAYPAWRAALGSLVDEVIDATADAEARAKIVRAYRERRAMCPFNDRDGACSIYPVRPALCRTANAVGAPEPCDDPDAEPEMFAHPAVYDTYEAHAPLRNLLHQALRPGHGFELLAEAVRRRLGAG